jgi:IS4 transposase
MTIINDFILTPFCLFQHDVTIARKVPLSPYSIITMDKGYNDYSLFAYWTENHIYFVTRLKDNADYTVVEEHAVPKNRNILADELIQFNGHYARKKCPHILRKVVVWDKEQNRKIVLLTNHRKFGATTISEIYKDRWQIELFFKALKQNLKVKTFVGTSENALYIQIWTALIAMLLIKYLRFKSSQNSFPRSSEHYFVAFFLKNTTSYVLPSTPGGIRRPVQQG